MNNVLGIYPTSCSAHVETEIMKETNNFGIHQRSWHTRRTHVSHACRTWSYHNVLDVMCRVSECGLTDGTLFYGRTEVKGFRHPVNNQRSFSCQRRIALATASRGRNSCSSRPFGIPRMWRYSRRSASLSVGDSASPAGFGSGTASA